MDKPSVGRFQHGDEEIRYVVHEVFQDRAIRKAWDAEWLAADEREFAVGYMPDDLTRECVRKMHYAAFRADQSRKFADRDVWVRRYFAMRDRVVLGNRKLVYGAVRKKMHQSQVADDLIGECYIVMIRAVAAFNPWIGIRFSTYAYTCLMRALARLNQRSMADRFSKHLSLDQGLIEEPGQTEESFELIGSTSIESYLQDEHPLLTSREKTVLRRRFQMVGRKDESTLEKVGEALGISKERVRQVQAGAIEKLRQVFVGVEG